MTVQQFGIWTNIFDYTPFFMIFSPVLAFWVTRFAARLKEGTIKTGVLSQLWVAIIAMVIYWPVIFVISNAIGTSAYLPIYLVAGFYILTYYMVSVFEAILQAVKPQATGFGFIIQEIVKVVVALILVLVFNLVFFGAIVALVIAPTIQILYYYYLLSGYFKEKVNWGYQKQWLKGSPAILFNIVGTQLVSLVLILLFLYGGSEARAYYQAALSFTTIVGYSSSLAVSLYPKLLSNSCSQEEVGLSFSTVMMLAIPLSTITMVMAVSFLTVLNAAYSVAWPVLIALTVDTLIVLVSAFYSSCLAGVESFDAEGQISLRKLVRSKIFKVFSIPYIQAAFALPIVYYVTTQLPTSNPVAETVFTVVVLISVHLATFIALYGFMRFNINIPVAWKNIAKYMFSAAIMGITLFYVPTTTTLLPTIAKAIAGFAVYTGILLVIDKQAQELVKLIILEIMTTLKNLHISKAKGNEPLTEN